MKKAIQNDVGTFRELSEEELGFVVGGNPEGPPAEEEEEDEPDDWDNDGVPDEFDSDPFDELEEDEPEEDWEN